MTSHIIYINLSEILYMKVPPKTFHRVSSVIEVFLGKCSPGHSDATQGVQGVMTLVAEYLYNLRILRFPTQLPSRLS